MVGPGLKVLLRQNGEGGLRILDVSQSSFGESGFQHLKGFGLLEELNAQESKVNDQSLLYLKGLTNLKRLHIGLNPISERGLKTIVGLKKLEELSFGGLPAMNDQVLNLLSSQKELRLLSVVNTSCTIKGCEALKKRLPDCRIATTDVTF